MISALVYKITELNTTCMNRRSCINSNVKMVKNWESKRRYEDFEID